MNASAKNSRPAQIIIIIIITNQTNSATLWHGQPGSVLINDTTIYHPSRCIALDDGAKPLTLGKRYMYVLHATPPAAKKKRWPVNNIVETFMPLQCRFPVEIQESFLDG